MTKEDKIIKILQKNLQLDMPYAEQAERDTAKEIADLDAEESVQFAKELHKHYMEFIEWLEMRRDHFWGRVESIDELLFVNFAEGSKKKFTLDEVYLHWLALPEKKEPKMYRCKCDHCKQPFQSSVKGFKICPSCYC